MPNNKSSRKEIADPSIVSHDEPGAAPRNVITSVTLGFALMAATFVGLGIWAAYVPLDSAVVAQATLTVETSRRTVQHLEGGIVDEVLVKEGSLVREGDILVRLDPTRARAQAQILRGDLDAQLALEARLIGERDRSPAFKVSAELESRMSDLRVAEIVEAQRNFFFARVNTLEGQFGILRQRIQQLQQQITGLRALEKSKRDQIGFVRQELAGLIGLVEEGIVTRTRVLALQREAARLEGELGEHITAIARTEQAIGETQMQIFQLQKQRQEEVVGQLRDTQSRIYETREKLIAAEDQMARTEIISPSSGTVMGLQFTSRGGVIPPAQPIMTIVPNDERMVLEAQVSPTEIDTIRTGLGVGIRFISNDAKFMPTIEGEVEQISADRVSDPRLGAPFFSVRISISNAELAKLGTTKPQNGMAAEVLIRRGERTVLQYIVSPLTERLSRAMREH